MNIKLLNKELGEVLSDVTVVFLKKDELEECEHADILQKAGFKAEQDTTCFLYEKATLFCGVDSKKSDDIRSAASCMMKMLKSSNYKSAKISVISKSTITALVEGVVLGGYEFNEYKSEPKKAALEEISLAVNDFSFDDIETIFNEALIVAHATNFTRDVVNRAPQEINPQTLAHVAQTLAYDNSLLCNILQEDDLAKENMGAMLAVGRASVHGSALIHLAYKPANPKKVITLVGKGLTYDSGGLSLKAPTSMVTMKMDKAGACAVLGIIKAVSELKLDIEIHAFIGAVENMVGGNAYKPDDVLVSRSKTTIEVRNTDAEGRLVLADVLDYAQDKVKADYIFDFATLTGACMIALGQYTTGLMGHSHKLKHDISRAGSDAGEMISSLPFNRHLKKLLKSEIADISNTASKPYGGAITAGMFLDKFIRDENKNKWMHFDIAGTAYTETPWDCNVYGATGAGVRLMCEFLRDIK
ncbi:MAG: leucyl aminopeptidase [Sulfurimonas sp. RIFCSPHIGHO2_12_FULL_36_9]|uniref:leucyl aminopeptidase n=1 Tax=unclassified Sulfurimonas TaxID=2623549 RepID=UPI0008B292A0|nr:MULTISPECIES: leucyl aminopeptidase [unclassified Sulfurimonas]OHD96269.1 MAG: leucyl aminopeptidase [Sulfurimonas sp. RIFCSPHIGHO2_12_FULL_36_9]OHE01890.1 MAG: leucyl aminopeptidase [Sulfurimonas sp. RIFCSPLOWO2_12_36_12]OHE02144.1 MAG: leucyl aminopeptidase [Sulfurimonas sp. RIFCSPLOWO2_12_FULL_36_74]